MKGAILLCVGLLLTCVYAQFIIVNTVNGPVQGVIQEYNKAFLGIPYAAAPVGDLRWSAPVPAKPWGPKPLNATVWSVGCPQDCVLPPHTCPKVMSEDCLNLNIYTPLESSDTPYPVMLFFPGGRFEQGSTGVGLYDGNLLANISRVIVITANYRLGALGLLVTSQLDGNYAIQDQRLVMNWIKTNIGQFGGNPNSITLMGQSAGAMSTAVHLVSPLSKGLFQQAVIQSDPFTLPMYSVSEAQALGALFVNDIGCSDGDLTCLRNASWEAVVAAEKAAQKHMSFISPLLSFVPWTPVVDPTGQELPQDPLTYFTQGQFNQDIPIIMGTVWNEALMFIFMAWNQTLTPLEYYGALVDIFLEDAYTVADEYPRNSTDGDDLRPHLGNLGTDYIFACTNRAVARGITKSSTAPVYRYVFDHILSFDAWGWRYPECKDYVCHGSELPFMFDSASNGGWYNFNPEEAELAKQMVFYWGNFAHSGNPNVGPNTAAVNWPAFTAQTDLVMRLQTPQSVPLNRYRGSECDFWDWMGYGWGFGW